MLLLSRLRLRAGEVARLGLDDIDWHHGELVVRGIGHEKTDTVQIYLHADLTLKERALARTAPLNAKPGRYRPPDALLAFLEAL